MPSISVSLLLSDNVLGCEEIDVSAPPVSVFVPFLVVLTPSAPSVPFVSVSSGLMTMHLQCWTGLPSSNMTSHNSRNQQVGRCTRQYAL
jgi:hypothetical protein